MKIGADRADGFCSRPDPKARVVLVYGPDEGLVRERVKRLMQTVVDDLGDPFRVAELTGAQLKGDPALLADEAAAQALTGGRRVVRVRDADDAVAKAVGSFLSSPAGEALVVLQGGDLAARSSLRKACESATNAAAVPCYLDTDMAVETLVRDQLAKYQLAVERDAMDFLAAHLGGDRAVTRQEIDKLITYMGVPGTVTLDDVMACIGDVSAMSMDDLVFALADGDATTSQRLLDRLIAEGTSAIPILRAVSRHFVRLHLAAGALAQRHGVEQALGLLKPPVFFKVRDRFVAQLRTWPPHKAGAALDILLAAEMDCKSTGMPEAEICSRAFLQIARAARAG